jgi:hypothetical protein
MDERVSDLEYLRSRMKSQAASDGTPLEDGDEGDLGGEDDEDSSEEEDEEDEEEEEDDDDKLVEATVGDDDEQDERRSEWCWAPEAFRSSGKRSASPEQFSNRSLH